MAKLKPCIVFDVDGTLVETPVFDFYGYEVGNDETPLLCATPIKEMAFLYHAVDYLINDPPIWAHEEGAIENWPKDIFFITARSEELRESTVQCISGFTHEGGTSISKRLLMRPTYMDNPQKDTSYSVKKHLITKLRDRGYEPSLVFDNDTGALRAFIEAGCHVVNQTVVEEQDKIAF